MAQADFGQAVDKGIARSLPEKPAERNVGHICQFGDFRQSNRLVKISIHIVECLLDSAAVICELFIGKSRI